MFVELTPGGQVRVVYAGPIRVVAARLGRSVLLDKKKILARARSLEAAGRLTIRDPAQDAAAQQVFSLAGTTETLFPLGLIGAFDLPMQEFGEELHPFSSAIREKWPYYTDCKVSAALLRVFQNGHAAVVLTLDFTTSPTADAAQDVSAIGQSFAFDGAENAHLKTGALNALNKVVPELLQALVSGAAPKSKFDGAVRFLSTFYVMSANWPAVEPHDVHLPSALRPLLQPEASDRLSNQSNNANEYVAFTSGFHMYVWNQRVQPDHLQRTISLVSFLNLMNILFVQIDDIKNSIVEVLVKRKTPFLAPTDIDERLEILYSQIMVSSSSWRRDFSSFRDEINRRWRLAETKQYCFNLIHALEARSARRRAVFIGALFGVISVAQLISIAEDLVQLLDRAR